MPLVDWLISQVNRVNDINAELILPHEAAKGIFIYIEKRIKPSPFPIE